jgi:prepilin-type N-terminal cleavage/methylation domain-containing protein
MRVTPLGPAGTGVSRRGFTLIEMVVATFLIALLSMLLALSWKTFGVPAVDVEARARLALSANLAAAALAQDMRGYQVRLEGKTGPSDSIQVYRLYKFDSWQNSEDHVCLLFKPENTASNLKLIAISYYVDSSTLVRKEVDTQAVPEVELPAMTTAVATHVKKLVVDPTTNQVGITVSYWRYEGTYGFSAINPQ